MKPIHIFSPGTHTDTRGRTITFTAADLQEIAEAYDPDVQAAPIVIGHPQMDDPAYGAIESLSFADGKLMATPKNVLPEFAKVVKLGAYDKISACFFGRKDTANPTPGKFSLRHVGFLGAAAPAVPGLDAIRFSAPEGTETFDFEFAAAAAEAWSWRTVADLFRKLREFVIAEHGTEKADEMVPSYQIERLADQAKDLDAASPAFAAPNPDPDLNPDPNKEPSMSGTGYQDLDARAAELDARQAEMDKQAATFAAAEDARRNDENEALLDQLIDDGRYPPGLKNDTLTFMAALDHEETYTFAAGDGDKERTPLDFFREEILGKCGDIISFGEVSGDTDVDTASVSFAAPDGYEVDASQMALHTKAEAYQAKHPDVSYMDAVRAVSG